MISKNEMRLNPRKRPKRPPRDETNSTGPIEMLRSVSTKGGKISLNSQSFLSRIKSKALIEPYSAQFLVQRRCSARQYPPPRRCRWWTHPSVADFRRWSVLNNHLLSLLYQGVKVSLPFRAANVPDVIWNTSRIHLLHLMDERFVLSELC